MSFFTELKRRNVPRVAIAYIVSGWLLVEVAELVLGTFGAPDWVLKTLMALLILGLPGVVFFAWAFEVTPEGLRRDVEVRHDGSMAHRTARRLDWAIIVLLLVAISFFAYDSLVLAPGRETARVQPGLIAVGEAVEVSTGAQAPVAQPDKSIAVLPFVNMSSDEEQAYFSDGLSEELLNLLAKIPDLRVAARTSSFSFKDQNLEIPEIAERLNVAHVLEGSVRKSGSQVRITAQLIQGKDGYHLWSETYDRTLDNIFAIQDEIAAAVVDELKISLLGTAPSARETNPEAFTLYLQARELGRRNTAESLEQSNTLYRQVLESDPGFAAAWTGLSINYAQQATLGLISSAEGYALARDAAERAVAIDPASGLAHASLGEIVNSADRNLAGAVKHVSRALELEPGNIDILRTAAEMFRSLGRLDEAIEVCEFMITLDPLNNNGFYALGLMNRYGHNLDQSIEAFRRALSLSPGRVGGHGLIAEALMLKGEPEAALEEIRQEEVIWRMIGLPMIYYALGRKAEADAALAELVEEHGGEAAYNIAYIHAFRGENDRSFEWLEKAIEQDDPGLNDLPVESLFTNLHGDPRWVPLLERLGKAPTQLDAIEFEVSLPE